MGKLIEKNGKFCIENTFNHTTGRCFTSKSKAQKELNKLHRQMRG